MKVSQITLYENKDGLFTVKIDHGGRVVKTHQPHKDARVAYREAAIQLVVQPGYVDYPGSGED